MVKVGELVLEPVYDEEWYNVTRRQGVTLVFDGPVCSALQGEASSPSPWQLQGGTAGEFVREREVSR